MKGFQNKGKVWPRRRALRALQTCVSPCADDLSNYAGLHELLFLIAGSATCQLVVLNNARFGAAAQAVQEDRAERLERNSQLMRAQLAQLEQQGAVSWPSPLSPLQQCVLARSDAGCHCSLACPRFKTTWRFYCSRQS